MFAFRTTSRAGNGTRSVPTTLRKPMRVCLFDIDGTLLSTGGAGKAAMEAALISEFRLEAVIDGVPYSGRTDRAIGRDLLGLHGIEDNKDTWRRLAAAYLAHLPQYL